MPDFRRREKYKETRSGWERVRVGERIEKGELEDEGAITVMYVILLGSVGVSSR
jgi:hypothetical protein